MISAPMSANWPPAKPSRSVKTRPPTRFRASTTTTSWPAAWISVAATRPDRPAPTTRTFTAPSHDPAAVEEDDDSRRVGPRADVESRPCDVLGLGDALQRHLALHHLRLHGRIDREPHLGRHRPGRDRVAPDVGRQLARQR